MYTNTWTHFAKIIFLSNFYIMLIIHKNNENRIGTLCT